MNDVVVFWVASYLRRIVLVALILPAHASASFVDEFITAGSGGLDDPRLFVFADNSLLIANGAGNAVTRFNAATGAFVENFTPSIVQPRAMTVGPDGLLYVTAGGSTDAIWRFDISTSTQFDVFADSMDVAGFNPFGIVFGPDNHLYVADVGSSKVFRFDGTTGALIDTFVSAGSGGLAAPRELVFGPDGNLYVSSAISDEILRFNGSTGAFIDAFVTGIDARDFLFSPDGRLYVADFAGDAVRRFDGTTGALLDTVVPSGSGGLDGPVGLGFGPDGFLYVSAFNSNNVLRFAVPEPPVALLLTAGLLGAGFARRRAL